MSPGEAADRVRTSMPPGGLFADQHWRTAVEPFMIDSALARELEALGRVLHQFYRAVNLLYRRSVEGKQPTWVADWLDRGKPADLIALQRHSSFKNDVPRVIRPDILLTDDGFSITELDAVPGGIGLTAWLNQTYEALGTPDRTSGALGPGSGSPASWAPVLGGSRGMLDGFSGIFAEAERVRIVVSDEAATYRPEMVWLAGMLGSRFTVHDSGFMEFRPGDAIYRFFELFDLANVSNSARIFELAMAREVRLTPPPKPLFEEKMLFALLWNRNLREFWRQELGEGFYSRLLKHVPYTWVVDPTPLPPQATIPELGLTDWQQLKALSQRERELILKVSGYHETAWGARSVHLGSDLSAADWGTAVDEALGRFPRSPHVLQRYHKPRLVEARYYDFEHHVVVTMPGRARLCPYFFVVGEGNAARPRLGGVLATICPADKKIIHGMADAILAPCQARS